MEFKAITNNISLEEIHEDINKNLEIEDHFTQLDYNIIINHSKLKKILQ